MVAEIEIETIKIERIFVDKIFATEFYYVRNMYTDVAKHLYDIAVLYKNEKIQKLLCNKEELLRNIEYKRQEEKVRIGGIEENKDILDFDYFKLDFNDEMLESLKNMQDKYVLNEQYKISINEIKEVLNNIYNRISIYK